MNTSIFGADADRAYMYEALQEARKAFEQNEVPIGALVVDAQGIIQSRAYNQVESMRTQLGHAEVLALQIAAQSRNNWRLDGHWLYVTLEPCAMCLSLARLSRIAGIVFGASSPAVPGT